MAGRTGRRRQLAIDPEGAWQDPDSVLSERIAADPAAVMAAWSAGPPAPADPWLGLWRAADGQITAAVEAELGDALSEPAVARGLGAWLPGDAALVVASSMPIRDIEEFMAAREDPPRVLANRGANGIDGTVSTAYGVAAAHDGPVVLLIGDVALAHDLGGLLAGRRLGLSLTIVLIDNDGGGIFSFLPVASQRDAFETHVATPHGLDFAHAAALYGARHVRADTPAALRAAVAAGIAGTGTTIVEVRTERAANLDLHRRIAARALAALNVPVEPGV